MIPLNGVGNVVANRNTHCNANDDTLDAEISASTNNECVQRDLMTGYTAAESVQGVLAVTLWMVVQRVATAAATRARLKAVAHSFAETRGLTKLHQWC